MNDTDLVVKSNMLNEARYNLTVQEQRFILTAISQIKQDDEELKNYVFSVREFCDIVGLKGGSAYSQLKDVTKTLLEKIVCITDPNGWIMTHWVSSVRYRKYEGVIELSFSPKLKPYLLALKKEFTRYQLKNVIRLKSVYSVRIYELLKQYQSIGSRYFELNELRMILAIGAGKYRLYGDFRRYVLDKAQKELVYSDIGFVYIPKKKVRRVVGIEFTIFSNDKAVKESYKKRPKEIQLEIPPGRPSGEDVRGLARAVLPEGAAQGTEFSHEELDGLEQVHRERELEKLKKRIFLTFKKKNNSMYQKLRKQAVKALKNNGRWNPKDPRKNTTIEFEMRKMMLDFFEEQNIKINKDDLVD